MKKVIFLNSGHSDLYPGARVPSSIYENESPLNMVIRDAVVPELEEQGFRVEVIPDDKNLTQSYMWVNTRAYNINDGLALSIHNNCCKQEGAEVYYYEYNQASKDIAQKLVDAYCEETGLVNRGAKSDTITRYGRLGWIRETNVWAILIECGYVDSDDIDFIINNIDIVARGIAKGVCRIYGIKYKENSDSLDREQIKRQIIELVNKL